MSDKKRVELTLEDIRSMQEEFDRSGELPEHCIDDLLTFIEQRIKDMA